MSSSTSSDGALSVQGRLAGWHGRQGAAEVVELIAAVHYLSRTGVRFMRKWGAASPLLLEPLDVLGLESDHPPESVARELAGVDELVDALDGDAIVRRSSNAVRSVAEALLAVRYGL